jgi:hypothetical protein
MCRHEKSGCYIGKDCSILSRPTVLHNNYHANSPEPIHIRYRRYRKARKDLVEMNRRRRLPSRLNSRRSIFRYTEGANRNLVRRLFVILAAIIARAATHLESAAWNIEHSLRNALDDLLHFQLRLGLSLGRPPLLQLVVQ